MPTSADKDFDVLAYFHAKDPKTGSTVFYHPDGDEGWAGAKKTFRGDPNSDQVKHLLDGAGGSCGPLIAEKKPATSTSANKES